MASKFLRKRFDALTRKQKIAIGGSCVGFFLMIVLLGTIFHAQIIEYFKPLAEKYTRRPGGFLLPSFMLMIASIPPLLGHELISFLTGFVYGNVGFLIVVVSTTIGESLLFLSFRHFLTERLVKFRQKYKDYDIFVRVIEEGGPYMIFAIRCSAIPSHFSTPLFASIEAIEYKTWLLCCLASCFSLYPPVYFGWLLKRGESSSATPWLLSFAAIITISVGLYIYVQYRRQKALHVVEDLTHDLESASPQDESEINLLGDYEGSMSEQHNSPKGSTDKFVPIHHEPH